ncbi:hypothetical protein DHEL01_v210690 [Diaporthe helianthi]|uniref:Ribonuclease H n=1 Tax=Diaporthe helianthi TaxID=158607 RepID=A0A2P5HKZ2_DIAHE|nr:hypothetical protein DHEL01_v210690 [Diaporthe helianthi]
MARKNKFCCYAVTRRRRPGLYYTWADCERQVKRYSGPMFRGFEVEQDAVAWLAKRGIDVNNLDSTSSSSPSPPPTTFDPPVHHGSASSASNVRGPFYAVARGRQPGIYHDWHACRKQVDGFSGARYKKFDTLAVAQEFCAVNGGGGHFSLFKSEGFEPDQKASFSDEWVRLSQSQGWERGTQRYMEQRASALRNEIQTHFFASQADQLPVVKEEEREGGPAMEAVSESHQQRNEAALELLGFQAMCRAVGRNPGETKVQCEMILKSTLINIVDLIDACRTGRDTTRLAWTDFAAFKAYTLDPYSDKTIPIKEAKHDPILRCFLQNFSAPRGVQNSSVPRDGPAGYPYAYPHTYSVRPPVAPPRQQFPAQNHYPRPCHNTQSVTTAPSATTQDGGVVVKKRAMSEEDDDFQDRGHQEKKVKTEEVIKVEVIESGVIEAGEMIKAEVIESGEFESGEVAYADKVTQVDDVIVVKEVKVKIEQDNDTKRPRREMKKIQQRWTPSNSIMRDWISSSV